MAGIKKTLGYKPATDPSGWGGTDAGTMRGTTVAGRNTGYWIDRLGGRLGKGGSSTTTMRIAAYAADKDTGMPGARLGNTNAFTVQQLMADRVSGADHETYVSGGPIPVPARQAVTLSALGTGASWAHGQDNSGAIMHERGGLSSVPSSFGSTNSRPEGNMALWGITYDDVAPTIPLDQVVPGHGQSTIDDTPTIAVVFQSENEILPGYSLGQADHLTKYQIQVYNAARTSKLHDSGRQDATSQMTAIRAALWTVPSALPPATYTVRAQVFNALGTPSAWREWTITVVGAGSIVLDSPTGVTNDATPDIGWDYTHKQGLAMDAMRVRVMDSTAKTIIRADALIDFATDPVDPSSGVLAWTDTGWDSLPVGAFYTVLAQAVDSDGQPSPWSAPQAFRVNAPPYVPINREPLPGAVLTAIPELSAMARDADNQAATAPTEFEVGKVSSGTTVTKGGLYDRQANRWRLNLITEGVIPPGDYGFWEWRARSTDQYGAVGAWSDWLTFEYVSAPVVEVVSPVATTDIANPAFDWTVDRAQTSYRIQLFNAVAGDPIRNGDTGWITSSDTTHTYTSLLLRNNQAVTGLLDVITSGDVPGSVEWDFTVAYMPPVAVTGVTADVLTEPYDYVNTASSVKVAWDKATKGIPSRPSLYLSPDESRNAAGILTPAVSASAEVVGDAWRLLEGTTNLVANPSAESNTASWSGGAAATLTRSASLPIPMPSGAPNVSTAIRAQMISDTAYSSMALQYNRSVTSGVTYTLTAWVYIPSGWQATAPYMSLRGAGLTIGPDRVFANLSIRDAWQKLEVTVASPNTTTSAFVNIVTGTTGKTGDYLFATAFQLEAKPYATPFTIGTRVAGTVSAPLATAPEAVLVRTDAETYDVALTAGSGSFGTYGTITHDGTNLTIGTSRESTVQAVVAYDDAVPQPEVDRITDAEAWSWNGVTAYDYEPVDPQEFSAYLIERVYTANSVIIVDPLAVIRDPDQTEWVDNTAPAGIVCEYRVMQEIWVALDLIPSLPTSDTAMVERIVGIAVTPVLGGGDGVVLPFLDSVNVAPVTDVTVRNSWAPKPRISRGPTQYQVIDVTAIMPTRLTGDFKLDDMLAALRELSETWVDESGAVRSLTVCLRLRDGRVFYGSITKFNEDHSLQETLDRFVTFQFTESNFRRGDF